MTGYIAGQSAEQLQRPGIGRRLLDSLLGDRAANGPGRTTTADLPPAQVFPTRPSLDAVDAAVPGATGAPMLPGSRRLGLGDGEPGWATAQDFEGID